MYLGRLSICRHLSGGGLRTAFPNHTTLPYKLNTLSLKVITILCRRLNKINIVNNSRPLFLVYFYFYATLTRSPIVNSYEQSVQAAFALTENSQTLSFKPDSHRTTKHLSLHQPPQPPRSPSLSSLSLRYTNPSLPYSGTSRRTISYALRFRLAYTPNQPYPDVSAPGGWPPNFRLPGCKFPIFQGATSRASSSTVAILKT